ncbi:hypothetical protein HZC32_01875 [Candidatus Woesearchaeota archaeon]|nr:hypothetical protein [Candidatus Woesearchaeota archaeon]
MPAKKLPSDADVFSPIKVKYKDVFDLKAFYEALHEWTLQHEWKDLEEGKDHYENLYSERTDRSGNKEMWIQWRATKKAEGGPFTYYLDFNFHVIGLSSVEVVKEGLKMKVNKGELELIFKGFIEKNYETGLAKQPLLKKVLPLFNKRVYRVEFEQRKKELYRELYILQNFIKQWFKLKRYLPYEETKGFFTSYAWPSHLKE